VIKRHAVGTYGGVAAYLHSFLILVLCGE